MPKREIDDATTDEGLTESVTQTAGERLREAREEKGLSLEDVAAQTRIPQRHLESIETADWEKLPAPTYTIGFAKSYALAVGLDRNDIGDQLREEIGGQRFASSQTEVIEAADPARTMPKWLVLSAIVAIIVVVLLFSLLRHHALQPGAAPVEQAAPAPVATPTPQQPQATAPAAQGAVVVTAVAPAWIQVTDQGKSLFQGELQQGQSYTVPQTAVAPKLRAGKPEALKVMVGTAVAPPVGPAGKIASNVSLKGEDLMRGGAAPAQQSEAAGQGTAPVAGNTAAR